MNFSEAVKELRRKRGWAQEDAAREIGVSLSTVQRWENGSVRPTRLAKKVMTQLFIEYHISFGFQGGGSSHGR